jgi:hypothetical protein
MIFKYPSASAKHFCTDRRTLPKAVKYAITGALVLTLAVWIILGVANDVGETERAIQRGEYSYPLEMKEDR